MTCLVSQQPSGYPWPLGAQQPWDGYSYPSLSGPQPWGYFYSSPVSQQTSGRKLSSSSSSLLDPADAQVGLLAYFKLTNVASDSMLHFQSWVDAGADNHPVCIIGLSADGQTATCLPMTSFGNRPIQEKFPNADHIAHLQYLAIEKGSTVPHSSLPLLKLAGGLTTPKQSYVGVDNFFQIETRYLASFNNNRYCLDAGSLETTITHLANYIGGFVPRRRSRSPSATGDRRPLSPLSLRAFTLQDLNVVDPRTFWSATPPACEVAHLEWADSGCWTEQSWTPPLKPAGLNPTASAFSPSG